MNLMKYAEEKHLTIKNINNSEIVAGILPSYAKIALPDSEDLKMCSMVESSIRKFVELNCPEKKFRSDSPLHDLHDFMNVEKIAECQKYVNDNLQLKMMKWACHVGRTRLSFDGNFFVDKEIYVRINYPFDVASEGKKSSATDPSHRLTRYNRGRPRASWGHGPHKDSWYGHSHSAINLWFSICGTNEESTMTLYPDHTYKDTAYDPESMYASYSENLGKNIRLKMNPGENFIFDPELLHSTRLNTSNETRIVLTLRISRTTPLFSEAIQHDVYDMWINSETIEKGLLTPEKVGKKVKITDYPTTDNTLQHYTHHVNANKNFTTDSVDRTDFKVADNILFELRCKDGDCLAVWNKERLFKFARHCPHVGAPLIGSEFNAKQLKIKCPAHGAEFCLKTGNSGARKLRVKIFD